MKHIVSLWAACGAWVRLLARVVVAPGAQPVQFGENPETGAEAAEAKAKASRVRWYPAEVRVGEWVREALLPVSLDWGWSPIGPIRPGEPRRALVELRAAWDGTLVPGSVPEPLALDDGFVFPGPVFVAPSPEGDESGVQWVKAWVGYAALARKPLRLFAPPPYVLTAAAGASVAVPVELAGVSVLVSPAPFNGVDKESGQARPNPIRVRWVRGAEE